MPNLNVPNCPSCHAALKDPGAFCSECGTKVDQSQQFVLNSPWPTSEIRSSFYSGIGDSSPNLGEEKNEDDFDWENEGVASKQAVIQTFSHLIVKADSSESTTMGNIFGDPRRPGTHSIDAINLCISTLLQKLYARDSSRQKSLVMIIAISGNEAYTITDGFISLQHGVPIIRTLEPYKGTPIDSALNLGMDKLEESIERLTNQGHSIYRSVDINVLDTDKHHQPIQSSTLRRYHNLLHTPGEKGLTALQVGVGDRVDWDFLRKIGDGADPLEFTDLQHGEILGDWISQVQIAKTESGKGKPARLPDFPPQLTRKYDPFNGEI